MIKRTVKILLQIIIPVVIIMGLLLGGVTIYSNYCKNRVYEEIEEKVDEEFLSGNIMLTAKYSQSNDRGASTTCYLSNGSGVIFDHQGDTYYALTAYHIYDTDQSNMPLSIELEGEVTTEIDQIVILYNSVSAEEESKNSKDLWYTYNTEELYASYPRATLEYVDEADDLAIISFESEEELSVIPISQETIYKDEKIMTVGNSEDGRFQRGYGKISSTKLKNFIFEGSTEPTKIIEHSAYVTAGFSGGAVVNENLELVGITTGGTQDFMGHFINGAMIPVDTLTQAISDWKNQKNG